jgi:ATP-dependent Clp protease ATP-binding subunit ClpX
VEPRNSVVKQYQKTLRLLDDVDLDFTEGALRAIAEEALRRKTGARALRSIIEELMLDVMFDVPSRSDVVRCEISEENVREGKAPKLVTCEDADMSVSQEDEPGQKTA